MIAGDNRLTLEETIVEAGGGAAVLLALLPLVIGVFVAILLHLARRDADTVPVWMAWAFSAFVAVAGVVGTDTVGVYFMFPAILLLIATAFTQLYVNAVRG